VLCVVFSRPTVVTPVVMFAVRQCCTVVSASLSASALVVLLLCACPFMLYCMATIISCPRVRALIVTAPTVPVLVGTAVVVLASGLVAMGLTEGRMLFVTIRVSVLLVVAVKFLVTVVTFAVLSAQVPYISVPPSSRM
jgi:hypothetical protein